MLQGYEEVSLGEEVEISIEWSAKSCIFERWQLVPVRSYKHYDLT